jgi:hypothetical protein
MQLIFIHTIRIRLLDELFAWLFATDRDQNLYNSIKTR